MGEYDSAIAVAVRLIKKKGRIVSFYQLDSSVVDGKPWKGTAGLALVIQQPAVFVPISSASELGFTLTSDDLSKDADLLCLTAPGAYDLTQFVGLIDDPDYQGPRLQFEWIQTLKPGDQVVLYAIAVRRTAGIKRLAQANPT